MASGTIELLNYGTISALEGRILWSSTANPAENTSRVTLTIQARKTADVSVPAVGAMLEAALSAKGMGSDILKTTTNASSPAIGTSWTTMHTMSFTILHMDDGTCGAYIGGIVTGVGEEVVLTSGGRHRVLFDPIQTKATITSAPNFNDEENPTITYSNPSGTQATLLQACISLDGSTDNIKYRDISKTGTSYTFNLTDAERAVLRNATLSGSNQRTVYFFVKTIVNGKTNYHFLTKTLTIINANPELSAIIMDTNETTVALTGDRLASIIKGYSNVSYEMSATARKGASIKSYSAVNGSTTKTTSSGVFNATTNNKFTLSATDNRGLSVKKEFTLNMVNYFEPTCVQEATIDFDGETTAVVELKISGEFFNGSFGAVQNAVDVQFRHKEGNGDFTKWISVSEVIWETYTNGNTYNAAGKIRNLPYDKAITIQSRVVDKLQTVSTAEYSLKLIPVFDWGEDDFKFNVPVSIKGDLVVNGSITSNNTTDSPVDYIIEQGTEAMGTNGTWYWSKWKSGKAECYGVRNFGNMAASTALGSLYQTTSFTQPLPTGLFSDAPTHCNIAVAKYNDYVAWLVTGTTAPTKNATGSFFLVRPGSANLNQVHLSFHVIGKWK